MHSSYQLTFNLHGLGAPPEHVPPEEVQYWLPVDFFVELLERVGHLPQVHLTFDDGNVSDFTVALPEMTKRGLRAEFFVTAGQIGQPGYLSPFQIRELRAAGMGVGLHGMSHRSWAQCDETELGVEVDEARRRIEAVIGRPVTTAACPLGAYNARSLRKLKRAGFERVYTSDGGVARTGEWLQCRNTLQNHHRVDELVAMVESPPVGLRDMLRRFRTRVKSIRREVSR